MKNSKIIKLAIILLIIFVTLISFNAIVYARTSTYDVIDDVINNDGKGYKPNVLGDESKLKQKVGVILGVINIVGVVLSVLTLMIIGMRYMFGSIEEKAEYKKTAVTYLLGAFLVFSMTTLPNIVFKISQNI